MSHKFTRGIMPDLANQLLRRTIRRRFFSTWLLVTLILVGSILTLALTRRSFEKPILSSDKRLHFVHTASSDHTQKLTNPIRLKIKKTAGQEFTPGKPLQLVGSVVIQQGVTQLDIVWSLSERVQLIEGQKKATLFDVKRGQVYDFPITILTESHDNEPVHLHVGMSIGTSRFSNSTMYNTTLEEAITNGKEALYERNKEFTSQYYKYKKKGSGH